MNSRVRWVSGAILSLLTVASACLAAEPPTSAVAADSGRRQPRPRRHTAAISAASAASADSSASGYVPGYQDYSKYAQVRMSFSANWRYNLSRSLALADQPRTSSGPGYSKHSNPAPFQDPNFPADPYKDDYLTLVLPISAQIQWVHRGRSLVWHLGAGPGAYRVWVENHRKVVPDPVTFDHHKGIYWGGSAELGFEHFFKSLPTTSSEVTLDSTTSTPSATISSPPGSTAPDWRSGLRVGANYYFEPEAEAQDQRDAAAAATQVTG